MRAVEKDFGDMLETPRANEKTPETRTIFGDNEAISIVLSLCEGLQS